MTAGAWALLIALPSAVVIGLTLRALQGRVRPRKTSTDVEDTVFTQLPEQLRQRLADAPEDNRICLLQLSTTFCAPCRHTRILLDNFAQRTEGVRHVEIDLTDHPDWTTSLRVHTTPTTLVLDRAGNELFRVSGVPRREVLDAALREHLA